MNAVDKTLTMRIPDFDIQSMCVIKAARVVGTSTTLVVQPLKVRHID
jgi:hypothetical protein